MFIKKYRVCVPAYMQLLKNMEWQDCAIGDPRHLETFAINEAIKVVRNHEEKIDRTKLQLEDTKVIVELDNGELFYINVKYKMTPIYSAEIL